MKNYKRTALVFDVDGTLIDSGMKLAKDTIQAFNNLGYQISLEEARISWRNLTEKYNVSWDDFMNALNNRKSWEQSLKDGEAPLFEDTIPCLEKLCSRGCTLGVLTKSNQEYTSQKLKFHNLMRYFDNYIEVVDINEKSKLDGAKRLIEKINPSNINSAYFIGDRSEDVLVSEVVNKKYQLKTGGIWINRNKEETPTELKKFQQIYLLNEIPAIIGAEYGR